MKDDAMRAENGNKVKVTYVGHLEDGTVFAEAPANKPFEFVLGQGDVIQGFEEAVQGMAPGEEKTIQVPPERAFGFRQEAKVIPIKREQFPTEEPLTVGARVLVTDPSGARFPARVEAFDDTTVTLDLNHPLAGRRLEFRLQLLEVS